MHCWKTINLKKQYGLDRVYMLSALMGLGVFMSFYIVLNILYSDPLSDQNFFFFILAILAVYPLHKAFHFLPLVGCRKCIKLVVKKSFKVFPMFSLHIKEPVSKKRFLFTLLSPFLLINAIIIILSISMPVYSHYFAMLLAYHCGLCLTDLIYLRNLAHSPKDALIEETETGYEILVPEAIV
ncbi:DUF3267 domain-containing protein [Planococcus sp. 107-1]|uniref:DUF3267 domain-containing protein n=1 Tax=Planococcus sp. 107-1 TaxID=2908840 RepID=UPI001F4679FD|nr:DUF3267 domain-containing protein [Planococcus sp. 107-1]UJF27869.1 DUF3267 domain-containing protein [Planococcus sp. 107-1]